MAGIQGSKAASSVALCNGKVPVMVDGVSRLEAEIARASAQSAQESTVLGSLP